MGCRLCTGRRAGKQAGHQEATQVGKAATTQHLALGYAVAASRHDCSAHALRIVAGLSSVFVRVRGRVENALPPSPCFLLPASCCCLPSAVLFLSAPFSWLLPAQSGCMGAARRHGTLMRVPICCPHPAAGGRARAADQELHPPILLQDLPIPQASPPRTAALPYPSLPT